MISTYFTGVGKVPIVLFLFINKIVSRSKKKNIGAKCTGGKNKHSGKFILGRTMVLNLLMWTIPQGVYFASTSFTSMVSSYVSYSPEIAAR
jgi:hypothetical protein